MLSSRYVCKKPFDPTEAMASSLGKRKTPTELRLEQLKRHQASKVGGQQEPTDTPGFAGKQRDAVVPPRAPDDTGDAVESGEKLRFRPLRGQKEKDMLPVPQREASLNQNSVQDSITLFSRYKSTAPSSNGSMKAGTQHDDLLSKGEEKTKGLHDCSFRDVRDISNSQSLLKTEASIDMVEALKRLAPRKVLGPFDINAATLPTDLRDDSNDQPATENGSSAGIPTSRNGLPSGPAEDAQAWLFMKGSRAPLDLSLKLLARITCSDSLHWCHRLSSITQCEGVQHFTREVEVTRRRTYNAQPGTSSGKSGGHEKFGAPFWNSLHSWIFPQSSLPPAVLSVISSAAARGGEAELLFLSRRYRAWEAAFRSLYYTFRSQACPLFYVCMQQFVAMFVGGGVGGRSQGACAAYLTRSTRGVRQVLLEHDIKFSMPFSDLGEPTTTVEDLQDLVDFEKSNPGQTRVVNERAASDNGPQSMLCFEGFSNIHRLYDFLLNHRSLITTTAAMDVPVLYSPTSFDNASLSAPEITCKQLQRTNDLTKSPMYNATKNTSLKCTEPASNTVYSMEIKGTFLPPWVITRLCTVLQESQPLGFSVRFATEPLTEGLNTAQEEPAENSRPSNFKSFFSKLNGITTGDVTSETTTTTKCSSEFCDSSGIGSAVVKELKYEVGVYKAVLAPLQLANTF